MKFKIKHYSIMIFSSVIMFSGCATSSRELNPEEGMYVSQNNQVRTMVKQKLERDFQNFEKQSVVKDRNIQYIRQDPIKIRQPEKHLIWTRADVINIDKDFLYIIPEGYRVIQEVAGEIYIDYEPTKEQETLLLDDY